VIADRVAAVRDRIARAAARAGRSAADVTLVAVCKTHPPAAVREAFAAGVRDVGENRVQEAEAKSAALGDLAPQGLRWHLVGHLQSNKARQAAALFDWVHSLDGAEIGKRLGEAAQAGSRRLRALVQVDLAGEETKFGIDEAQLFAALESLRAVSGLELRGLMALPPYEEDAERVRPYFRRLRALRDRAREKGLMEGTDLSMGMSHDLEVAVEEGATLVRVGTAIFGERPAERR
jgi:pyridoxal phosphate enzyme (YggS family)